MHHCQQLSLPHAPPNPKLSLRPPDCFTSPSHNGIITPQVDYILFIRIPVDLRPNPEEVQATRYVTWPELKALMSRESGLQWSPWFRIIASHFLEKWWADLDGALAEGSVHDDFGSVHKLKC
jgi:isopentenyldiphosphate isomerase